VDVYTYLSSRRLLIPPPLSKKCDLLQLAWQLLGSLRRSFTRMGFFLFFDGGIHSHTYVDKLIPWPIPWSKEKAK